MNGTAIAFSEIQLRYELYIFLIILSRVGDRHEAENLCQDTFLNAFEAVREKRYTAQQHFTAWLISIAEHVISDWKKHKMNRVEHVQFSEEMEEVMPAPVITYGDPLLQKILGTALAKLSTQDYTILIMHAVEEKTYEEISPVVNLTPAAVKQRFLRMCRRLRKVLIILKGKF